MAVAILLLLLFPAAPSAVSDTGAEAGRWREVWTETYKAEMSRRKPPAVGQTVTLRRRIGGAVDAKIVELRERVVFVDEAGTLERKFYSPDDLVKECAAELFPDIAAREAATAAAERERAKAAVAEKRLDVPKAAEQAKMSEIEALPRSILSEPPVITLPPDVPKADPAPSIIANALAKLSGTLERYKNRFPAWVIWTFAASLLFSVAHLVYGLVRMSAAVSKRQRELEAIAASHHHQRQKNPPEKSPPDKLAKT